MKLTDFLSIFFPDEDEPIRFRGFKPKGQPPNNRNWTCEFTVTRKVLQSNNPIVRRIVECNETRGMYFVVNAGIAPEKQLDLGVFAQKKEDDQGKLLWTQFVDDEDIIKHGRFTSFFAEMDELLIKQQHEVYDSSPIPPPNRVETLKSVHGYWPIEGPCSEEEWREVQARLITYYNSDPLIKNPSRVMRLPGLQHLTYHKNDVITRQKVVVSKFDPKRRFTVAEMLSAFPAVQQAPKTKPVAVPGEIRNKRDWYNELRRRMYAHSTAKQRGEWVHLKGLCHDGEGNTAQWFNVADQRIGCLKGCDHETIGESHGMPPMPEWVEPSLRRAAARTNVLQFATAPRSSVVVDFLSRFNPGVVTSPQQVPVIEPDNLEADLCPVCAAPLQHVILDKCELFACSVDESHHYGRVEKKLDASIPTNCPTCGFEGPRFTDCPECGDQIR